MPLFCREKEFFLCAMPFFSREKRVFFRRDVLFLTVKREVAVCAMFLLCPPKPYR